MKKSFTLIELLIVLVIIAIVIAVALPCYNVLILKAQKAEAMRVLQVFSDSLWRYYLEAGCFPDGGIWDPPPANLDMKIPTSTKYWGYYYSAFSFSGYHNRITASAYSRSELATFPIGGVFIYGIQYVFNEIIPLPLPEAAQQIDSHWYKQYYRTVKTSDSGTEEMAGWD